MGLDAISIFISQIMISEMTCVLGNDLC
jgi:hypothetical protein